MSTDLPRERIPWFPTIDFEACLGDQECFKFCKNHVFEWDEEHNVPLVANPYNCVLGCNACAKTCAGEAITFPTLDELRATIRRLRAELERTAGQSA